MLQWQFLTTGELVGPQNSNFGTSAESQETRDPEGSIFSNHSGQTSYAFNNATFTESSSSATGVGAFGTFATGQTKLFDTYYTFFNGQTISTTETSTSGSVVLGSVLIQTTSVSSIETDFITTATSSFQSTYITSSSSSTGGIFTLESTGSYVDITTTSSSSIMDTTVVVTSSAQASYGNINAFGFLPSPGEVAWYASQTLFTGYLSELVSTTGSFSLVPLTIDSGSGLPITGTYNFTNEVSTLVTDNGITESTGTASIFVSDFGNGGFFEEGGDTFIQGVVNVTNTEFPIIISSSSDTVGFLTFSTYYIFSENLTSINTLQLGNVGITAGYSTYPVNVEIFSLGTYIGKIDFGNSSSSSFSTTGSGILPPFTISATGMGGATTGITGNFQITAFPNLTVVFGNAIALTKQPNTGFRLNPKSALVSEIGFGGTLSLSPNWGSFVFTADGDFGSGETVPISYPGTNSWIDSNGKSYEISWSSLMFTVTGSSTNTYTSSSSTLTSTSTASSNFTWTAGAEVTQTLFNVTQGSPIFMGSGSYGSELAGINNTLLLSPGAYARSGGSNVISDFSTYEFITADFVRTLAMGSVFPGNDPVVSVDIRSNYS